MKQNILAGVSINLVLGDNGIITKAKEGKKKNNIAQAREKIEIVLGEASIHRFTEPKYNQNEYLDEMILSKVAASKVNEDIVISDRYAFIMDRNIPAIVDYVGEEKDLVFPQITTNVTIAADKKTATITITAQEEENGIKKIEILQDGIVIQSWSYETPESEKIVSYSVSKNENYIVKVTSSTTASEIITITGLESDINYNPVGSTEWKKEHQVKITMKNMDEIKSIKYQWTETTTQPDENTFSETVGNDGIITENTLTGKYYLWILLEDNSGNTNIEKSEAFYFDNTRPTANINYDWLDENEVSSLKNSVNNIIEEHSGINKDSVMLYITHRKCYKTRKEDKYRGGRRKHYSRWN